MEPWTKGQHDLAESLFSSFKDDAEKMCRSKICNFPNLVLDEHDIFVHSIIRAVANNDLRKTSSLRSWFMKIVANYTRDAKRNSHHFLFVTLQEYDKKAKADDASFVSENRVYLRKIRERLDDEEWFIFTMLSEGYEYDEISPLIGCSVSALKTRVHRLRRDLNRARNRGFI